MKLTGINLKANKLYSNINRNPLNFAKISKLANCKNKNLANPSQHEKHNPEVTSQSFQNCRIRSTFKIHYSLYIRPFRKINQKFAKNRQFGGSPKKAHPTEGFTRCARWHLAHLLVKFSSSLIYRKPSNLTIISRRAW